MPRTTDLRGDKIIDSRDVIKRYEELNDERENLVNTMKEAQDALDEAKATLADFADPTSAIDDDERDEQKAKVDDAQETLTEAEAELDAFNQADGDELTALKALIDQCEGYGDWACGETLIRDDYFTEYAEELARDCGMITDKSDKWPYTCIDWDRAAEELKQDYMEVDFDGTTYWMRT